MKLKPSNVPNVKLCQMPSCQMFAESSLDRKEKLLFVLCLQCYCRCSWYRPVNDAATVKVLQRRNDLATQPPGALLAQALAALLLQKRAEVSPGHQLRHQTVRAAEL